MHIIKLKSFLKLLTVEYEEDYQIRTFDSNSQKAAYGGGKGTSTPGKLGDVLHLHVKLGDVLPPPYPRKK